MLSFIKERGDLLVLGVTDAAYHVVTPSSSSLNTYEGSGRKVFRLVLDVVSKYLPFFAMQPSRNQAWQQQIMFISS